MKASEKICLESGEACATRGSIADLLAAEFTNWSFRHRFQELALD